MYTFSSVKQIYQVTGLFTCITFINHNDKISHQLIPILIKTSRDIKSVYRYDMVSQKSFFYQFSNKMYPAVFDQLFPVKCNSSLDFDVSCFLVL